MGSESYTPGHTANATDFMAQRSLDSHGQFFLRYLEPGLTVLDCGCGPGSITQGIARLVDPAGVVGVDRGASQIDRANKEAAERGSKNVRFVEGDCYSLPFPDGSFDRVFSHALLEHLSDPVRALAELGRVLKAGGWAGICSPDWGGFVVAPPSPELASAIAAYTGLQTANGGDVNIGRKLGACLAAAGFKDVRMHARYECYSDLSLIGEYLAQQLQQKGQAGHAGTLRSWAGHPDGLFAQCWVSAVGQK